MKRQYEFIRHRHNDEATLQQMVVRYLDSKGILYIASLMGVNLGPRVGAIRKKMGCRPGVLDLLILEARGKWNGFGLELKIKGGHITNEQTEFAGKLTERGYYAVIMPPTMEVQEAFVWAQIEIERYLRGVIK
jgi:hypothetical protein